MKLIKVKGFIVSCENAEVVEFLNAITSDVIKLNKILIRQNVASRFFNKVHVK